MTAAARTMQAYRAAGCTTGIVERWIQQARRRVDLFGFIDGIALDTEHSKIIAWQATTGAHLPDHVAKIKGECAVDARWWIQCGGKIQVWGWRRLKLKRGGKAVRWEAKVIEIVLVGGELTEKEPF